MGKFKFDLENVLKVKQIREDQAKARLLAAQKEYQEIEYKLNFLYESQAECHEGLRKMNQGICEVSELKIYYNYLTACKDMIARQKEKLEEADKRVEERRQVLVAKVKERKILENLKAKKLLEFQKIELQKEQNFLDEIATNNYARPK